MVTAPQVIPSESHGTEERKEEARPDPHTSKEIARLSSRSRKESAREIQNNWDNQKSQGEDRCHPGGGFRDRCTQVSGSGPWSTPDHTTNPHD